MIEHTLDQAHSILYVRPKSRLEPGDFVQLAKTVDPFIEERGALSGLILEATGFPLPQVLENGKLIFTLISTAWLKPSPLHRHRSKP
jgi:hypothetical protein